MPNQHNAGWTLQKAIELLQQGLTLQEVGDRFGVSKVAIGKRFRSLDDCEKFKRMYLDLTEKRKPSKGLPVKDQELLPLLDQGFSLSEIGEKLGVTKQAVHQRIKKLKKEGVV